jgi:ribosomal protein L11 methyltransferase
LIRLAVRVGPEHAELVLAELLELAPGGVEERVLPEGDVEYAVYGAPGELPALPDLKAAAGDALVDISTEEIPDDWSQRWREFHRPLVIEDRLAVRPPWEPASGTAVDIVIDPGRAFGTGAHATTRLCLELMLELASREGAFVDLGCGSGVLAIAAAKLGWGPVLALDYDRAAVEATLENARANAVELQCRRYDLRTDPVTASVAPTVAANLLAPLLLRWAERLTSVAPRPDRVIAGGLLRSEGDAVAHAFAGVGLRETRRLAGGDWIALLLERDVFSD